MYCPFNSGMIPGQGKVLEYRLGLPRGGQRVPVQSLLCHVQVQLHLMRQISIRCNLNISSQCVSIDCFFDIHCI
jgi:hypothetical protein